MTAPSAPRVLVIDNDPRIGELLKVTLQRRGYRVCVAEGTGSALLDHAKAQAKRFRPHVAIVDLRLIDDFMDERSGLDLLPDLQSARCILCSAHLNANVTLEAAHKYKAFAWVDKYDLEALYDAVERAAHEASACKRGIHIQWPASWHRKEMVQRIFADAEHLPDDSIFDDLIAQLFLDRERFYPDTVSGAVNGLESVIRGRSAVIKIFPEEQLEPKILKMGNAQRIAHEDECYRRYVKDYTPNLHATQLERSTGFWDLGGAVYSFIGSSEQALPTFAIHYAGEEDIDKIVQPLRHFFCVVWRNHYEQAAPATYTTLYDAYQNAFNIEGRIRLIEERLFPTLQQLLRFDWQDPTVWVTEFGRDSTVRNSRQAITHGDLHGDNLFVEQGRAWIIDFERTGPGHALRDFAELEVDIFTRLAQGKQLDWPALLALAQTIVQPTTPATPVVLSPAVANNGAAAKAVAVINEIRALAQELVRHSDQREYLWGMLFDALFIASIHSADEEQKLRAMLLSTVICERLRTWGSPWVR